MSNRSSRIKPFDPDALPPVVEALLRQGNPWWTGAPGPVLPPYRRGVFGTLLRKLESGPAAVTVLRGPRQVGKTTLQGQLIQFLLEERQVPPARIFRIQFDDLGPLRDLPLPLLRLVWWFERHILGRTLNEAAHAGVPAYLFLDEAQNLTEWAPQLKSLVDHQTARVMLTGSSSLRIRAGQDSLAGRISTLEIGPLSLREIAGLRFHLEIPPLVVNNDLEPLTRPDFWKELQRRGEANREVRDAAFLAFSERGGYPIAQKRPDLAWDELAEALNESVIERVIRHDLRHDGAGRERDSRLLEEVFRVACRYAGQAPGPAGFAPDIRTALGREERWRRIQAHLRLLEDALLLRLVRPVEMRLKRPRGHEKICLCDHGLRAAWLREIIPLAPPELARDPGQGDLAGHLAESVAGYFLAGLPHLDLAHFPARGEEPEMDFVLTVGDRRIPVEIKYRRHIDSFRDTQGLRSFLERTAYNAPLGILITLEDGATVLDPRIVCVSLPSLLLMR